MLIKVKCGWELPESAATPESIYLSRRTLTKAIAAGPLIAAGASLPAWAATDDDPTADLYPVPRNERYTVTRALTREEKATTYNNFYEFGSHKRISKVVQDMVTRPWIVHH
jgi:sulfoxide reductase catalytic subunit YedY